LDETVDDYFFVIKDDTALNNQNPSEVLDLADLVQIANGATATFGDKGWALPFTADGEKATASPLIFGGRVFFTSYEPGVDASGIEACEVKVGTSYLYVRDLVTGTPLTVNGGTTTEPNIPLDQDVPPPTPTPISDGENTVIVVGTEIVGGDEIGGTNVRRGSWYQLAPAEPDKVPLP
jgi:type IV pilus assembly protein PilY1